MIKQLHRLSEVKTRPISCYPNPTNLPIFTDYNYDYLSVVMMMMMMMTSG